jgi:hypothetical protein
VDPTPLLDRVFDDEGITSGLDEAEAETLLKAVAERVKAIAAKAPDYPTAQSMVETLCRKARDIARTVSTTRGESPAIVLKRLLPTLSV